MCKLRCANLKLAVSNILCMFVSDICSVSNLYLHGTEYHYVLVRPF